MGRLLSVEKSRGSPGAKSLSVRIYNKERDGELHQVREGMTCENVCIEIGKSQQISPTLLHCFSLKKYCKSRQDGIWLSPQDELKIQTDQVDIHFRMRFIPQCKHTTDIFQNKHLTDDNCLRYLFWQINWDFLHDKIECYKQNNKERARGLIVLCVLIQLRQYTELQYHNNVQGYIESLDNYLVSCNKSLRSFFPVSMKGSVLDRIIPVIENNIKSKVKDNQKHYPFDDERFNSLALMKSFIRSVLQEETGFFMEQYSAYKVDFTTEPVPQKPDELRAVFKGKEKLNLIVDMSHRPAEIFIHNQTEKTRIPIDMLSDLKLTYDETSKMEKVHLFVMDRPPEEIYFEEIEEALSFATCVETYYRLYVNFYQSLCSKVEPRLVKEINVVKAHGPVSTDYIQHKLGKQYGSSSDVYVLRKGLHEYDSFELVRQVKGSDRLRVSPLGKLRCTQDGYSFDENKEPMKDLKKLMHNTICEVEGLLPENCSRIHPKFEACDVLKEFFLQEVTSRIQEEDEEDMQQRQELENQPKIIMPSDLVVKKLIGKGYFTEVYQGLLKNEETVIVKRLRLSEIMRELDGKAKCSQKLVLLQEAFCESFDKLVKLRNRKFFLDFLGQRLQYPLEMVLKEEKYGNLQYFLETRPRYEFPLTMHHLQTVTIQLAYVLEYMEDKNCFHGNLHCKNIIVTKFSRKEMVIKITDPGMVSYYNRLDLGTKSNRNRLPWIAPELYENLTAVNIRTEVYSYGMTLWQMYQEGQSPVDHTILIGKTVEEMCQFFSNEEFQLPCPLYLRACIDDSKEIKQIKKNMFEIICTCCCIDQEQRISPKELLRKLLGIIFDNEEAYHDYNIIYERESSSYSIRSSSGVRGSAGTSGIVTNYRPVTVPIKDIVEMDFNGENTTPKFIDSGGHGNNSQGTICSIEPGCMLSGSEKPVQMPSCPVHQASLNSPESKRGTMDPIVSDVKFIIAKDRLTIDKSSILGSGFYGTIHKGTLELSTGSSHVPVAVKALKESQADKFREEFKKEASIMEKLMHPNIVKFYGIYQEGRYMVMELVEKGSLYSYVQSHKSKGLSEEKQLQISVDIASGMAYLASKQIIHCDLAARNVLLASDFKAKVSDFGLSKILCQDKDYYRRTEQRTIPILWCAPEWIGYKKFYFKSDVWSFGVVLWEIYTYGKLPLIGNDNKLNDFYKNLFEDKRLEKPKDCSKEMYSLMKSCWHWHEDARPTFLDLKNRLENMLKEVRPDRRQAESKENPGVAKNSRDSVRTINGISQDSVNDTQTVRNTPVQMTRQAEEDQHETFYQKANPSANFVEQSGTVKDTSKVSLKADQDGLNDKQTMRNTTRQVTGQVEDDKQTRGYRKANSSAVFVAQTDRTESQSTPTKTFSHFPRDPSKTAPEKGSPFTPLPKGSDTYHGMTQKKMTRSFDNVIEAGLTVHRDNILGQGRFGKVLSGVYNENRVAVKTCIDDRYKERFKREYQMLQDLKHPNIVKCLGIHRPENGCGLEYVMEFMEKGSLRSLLQSCKSPPVSLCQKIKFLDDIAQGMKFLFERHVLHGDLTADNILVNAENTAKISDFGLCKQFDDSDVIYTRNDAIMKPAISPPESFRKKYTKYSDIWSYGVLCLEVILDGGQPNFQNPLDFQKLCSTDDINPLLSKLEAGERFQRPESCPYVLYDAVRKCWELEPENRIQYTQLIQTFKLVAEDLPEEV